MMKSKYRSEKGFIHVFFMGAVVILLMVFFNLTSQGMDQKIYRAELETKLKLDYATEAYYLLIREGEMWVAEGISYGDLTLNDLNQNLRANPYIEVDRKNHIIIISSWFKGERRGGYEIEKEEGVYDD
ncbi:MAG: hypothetical protein GX829_07905 [Clostridium sp.]|nr:hypothetical protein [Clostridium sp.]